MVRSVRYNKVSTDTGGILRLNSRLKKSSIEHVYFLREVLDALYTVQLPSESKHMLPPSSLCDWTVSLCDAMNAVVDALPDMG